MQQELDELFPNGTVIHAGAGTPGQSGFRFAHAHPTARPFVITALEVDGIWYFELVADQRTMQDWESIERTGFATNADKPGRFWIDTLQESDEFDHLLEAVSYEMVSGGETRFEKVYWLRFQLDPKSPEFTRTAEERQRITDHWMPEIFPQGLKTQQLVAVGNE